MLSKASSCVNLEGKNVKFFIDSRILDMRNLKPKPKIYRLKQNPVSALCGLTTPSSGKIQVLGSKITNTTQFEKSQGLRKVGICLQEDFLWDDLTVAEYLYTHKT